MTLLDVQLIRGVYIDRSLNGQKSEYDVHLKSQNELIYKRKNKSVIERKKLSKTEQKLVDVKGGSSPVTGDIDFQDMFKDAMNKPSKKKQKVAAAAK